MNAQKFLFSLWDGGANDGLIREAMQASLRKLLSITYAMTVTDGDVLGKEFGNGSRWGFILKEMSVAEYQYRVQWFREDGFASHESYRTYDEAVENLFTEDGLLADFGALDRLSKKAEWHLGSYALGLIDQVNRGTIKYREALILIANRREQLLSA